MYYILNGIVTQQTQLAKAAFPSHPSQENLVLVRSLCRIATSIADDGWQMENIQRRTPYVYDNAVALVCSALFVIVDGIVTAGAVAFGLLMLVHVARFACTGSAQTISMPHHRHYDVR